MDTCISVVPRPEEFLNDYNPNFFQDIEYTSKYLNLEIERDADNSFYANQESWDKPVTPTKTQESAISDYVTNPHVKYYSFGMNIERSILPMFEAISSGLINPFSPQWMDPLDPLWMSDGECDTPTKNIKKRYSEMILGSMVCPKTLQKVEYPFSKPCSQAMLEDESRTPHPVYYPHHDHDYTKKIGTDPPDQSELDNTDDMSSDAEPEPLVDVWELDDCRKNSPTAIHQTYKSEELRARNVAPYQQKPRMVSNVQRARHQTCKKNQPTRVIPDAFTAYQTYKKETRPSARPSRTSLRAAEMKRRLQERKLSNAVTAGLKNRAQRARQYKNIKPKNSVETTPSQSDIEEWSWQPARPTYTRITKKKTSKGRIDHSESERHRRGVLKEHFSSLCDLVPHKYLQGEKASTVISKQKILDGAKAFIVDTKSSKSTYQSCFRENTSLRDLWFKSTKIGKCVKREK